MRHTAPIEPGDRVAAWYLGTLRWATVDGTSATRVFLRPAPVHPNLKPLRLAWIRPARLAAHIKAENLTDA